eukprot:gene6726-23828_t
MCWTTKPLHVVTFEDEGYETEEDVRVLAASTGNINHPGGKLTKHRHRTALISALKRMVTGSSTSTSSDGVDPTSSAGGDSVADDTKGGSTGMGFSPSSSPHDNRRAATIIGSPTVGAVHGDSTRSAARMEDLQCSSRTESTRSTGMEDLQYMLGADLHLAAGGAGGAGRYIETATNSGNNHTGTTTASSSTSSTSTVASLPPSTIPERSPGNSTRSSGGCGAGAGGGDSVAGERRNMNPASEWAGLGSVPEGIDLAEMRLGEEGPKEEKVRPTAERSENGNVAAAAAAAAPPMSPLEMIEVVPEERARRSSQATAGSTWVQPAKKKVGKPRRGSRAAVGTGVPGGGGGQTLEEVKRSLLMTKMYLDKKGVGASSTDDGKAQHHTALSEEGFYEAAAVARSAVWVPYSPGSNSVYIQRFLSHCT